MRIFKFHDFISNQAIPSKHLVLLLSTELTRDTWALFLCNIKQQMTPMLPLQEVLDAQAIGHLSPGAAPFGVLHDTVSARISPRACLAALLAVLPADTVCRDRALALHPGPEVETAAGRLLRDAKLYEIGAGTSEIRRWLIGRELFEETV